MTRQFKAFVTSTIALFLLIIGASIFVNTLTYNAILSPRDLETMTVFVMSDYSYNTKFKDNFKKDFEDTSVYEFVVDNLGSSDPSFGSVFQTRGLIASDIVIIEEDYVKENDYPGTFRSIDESKISGNGIEYIYYSGYKYGIDVTNIITNNFHTKDGKKYYLFINGRVKDNKEDLVYKAINNIINMYS